MKNTLTLVALGVCLGAALYGCSDKKVKETPGGNLVGVYETARTGVTLMLDEEGGFTYKSEKKSFAGKWEIDGTTLTLKPDTAGVSAITLTVDGKTLRDPDDSDPKAVFQRK